MKNLRSQFDLFFRIEDENEEQKCVSSLIDVEKEQKLTEQFEPEINLAERQDIQYFSESAINNNHSKDHQNQKKIFKYQESSQNAPKYQFMSQYVNNPENEILDKKYQVQKDLDKIVKPINKLKVSQHDERRAQTRVQDMQNQLPRNWMKSKGNQIYLWAIDYYDKHYKSRFYFFMLIATIKFLGTEIDQHTFINDFYHMIQVKKDRIRNNNKYSQGLKQLFCIDFDYLTRATDIFFNTQNYKEAIKTVYIRDKNILFLPPRTQTSIKQAIEIFQGEFARFI